jgi:trimeric autotransporter adhesin
MNPAVLVPFLVLFSVAAVAPDVEEIRNWTAPPYWSPPASERAEEAGRAGPGPGREALALPSSALPFVAIPPCRIVDTRGGAPFTGGKYLAGESRDYQFSAAGAPCTGIPATAAAFSLNFTVTQTDGAGFLAAYPRNGRPVPLVSTLNYTGNQTLANGAVVPGDATGFITVIAGVSGTHVIVDVNGYYAGTGVVTSVNTKVGDVTLAAGTNVTITPSGNTLTIAAGGGPVVSSLNALTGAVTLAGGGATTVTPSGNTLTLSTPAGWNLSGNPGTTPGTDFLGTTDNQPLEIKVNNQRVGRFEPAYGLPNVILGDRGNSVLAGVLEGTVSGGGWASLFGPGDGDNIVTGHGGTVGGGVGNQAGDNDGNPGTGQYVTVGGGFYNEAWGEIATIAGGHLNRAPGERSAVPGGYNNQAGGAMSLAAGNSARIRSAAETGTTYGDYGTFVWADSPSGGNSGVAFTSTGPNQFLIRAGGGVGVNKSNPAAGTLDVNGSVVVGNNLSLPATGSAGAAGVLTLGGVRFLHARGTSNTFVGGGAGNFSLSGANNTAVGYIAGNRSDGGTGYTGGAITYVPTSTGSWNTFLGEGTGATADVSNCTAVGVDAYCDSTDQVRLGNFFVSSIGGKVGWSALSDLRAKKDVRDLSLGLEFVMGLRPVEYRLKYGNERVDMGFVAQDVEELLGDGYNVVDVGGDAERTLSLRYADLIAPLVKAVQEQQRALAESKEELASLRALVEDLRAELRRGLAR